MCGIGGFSLSAESKINPRRLSNALLTALEDRGYMASGYAWHTRRGHGYYKQDIAGSQISLKSMPKEARVGIVHTRLATHGSITVMDNNHPVLSPSGDIALVHNGVIYNHNSVRRAIPHKLPEVDTSVIPALIEDANLERLTELDGDAAISWLSESDLGVLNVARLSHSPLVIAQVEDGSFIFASTESLLWRVLIQLDLMPEFMQTVSEYTYYKVREGRIVEMLELEVPTHTTSGYDYGYYRHQTAGAKGSYANDPWAEDDDYWQEQWSSPAWADKYDEQDEWEAYNGAPYVIDEPVPDAGSEYWIEYKSALIADRNLFMWYPADDKVGFNADVWLLRNDETDYELVDYGAVARNGSLVSYRDK